jgi:hypothetical protein
MCLVVDPIRFSWPNITNSFLPNAFVKRFADKRDAIVTGHLGKYRKVSSRMHVYNTDRFSMQLTHMCVDLSFLFRYERRIDNVFEIQNMS